MSNNYVSIADEETSQYKTLRAIASFHWTRLPKSLKRKISIPDLVSEGYLYYRQYGKNQPEFRNQCYRWGMFNYVERWMQRPQKYRGTDWNKMATYELLENDLVANSHSCDLARTESRMLVEDILAIMKPDATMQQVLQYHTWEGNTFAETAGRIGITRQAAEMRYKRFINKCRLRFAA